MFRRADQMQAKLAADADRRLGLREKASAANPTTKSVRCIRRPDSSSVKPGSDDGPVTVVRRRRSVEITTEPVRVSPPPAPVRVAKPEPVPVEPIVTSVPEPEPVVIEVAPVAAQTPAPIVEASAAPKVVPPSTDSLENLAAHFRSSPLLPVPPQTRPVPTPAMPRHEQRPRGLDEHPRFRGSPAPKPSGSYSGPGWTWSGVGRSNKRKPASFEEQHGDRIGRLKQRAEALHPQAAEHTVPAERLGLGDLLKPQRLSKSWEPEKKETAFEAVMRAISGVKDLATLMALEKHMGALETTSERIRRNPAKFVAKTAEAVAAK